MEPTYMRREWFPRLSSDLHMHVYTMCLLSLNRFFLEGSWSLNVLLFFYKRSKEEWFCHSRHIWQQQEALIFALRLENGKDRHLRRRNSGILTTPAVDSHRANVSNDLWDNTVLNPTFTHTSVSFASEELMPLYKIGQPIVLLYNNYTIV